MVYIQHATSLSNWEIVHGLKGSFWKTCGHSSQKILRQTNPFLNVRESLVTSFHLDKRFVELPH